MRQRKHVARVLLPRGCLCGRSECQTDGVQESGRSAHRWPPCREMGRERMAHMTRTDPHKPAHVRRRAPAQDGRLFFTNPFSGEELWLTKTEIGRESWQESV